MPAQIAAFHYVLPGVGHDSLRDSNQLLLLSFAVTLGETVRKGKL